MVRTPGGTATPTLATSANGRGIMMRAAASRWANSAAMCSLRPASTAWTATRMAFLMALGLEEPWQMIETPRTPSSGAPPYSE